MNAEGKVGWEEIVDSGLDGKFDEQELNEVACLGHKCINRAPRKRPSMRDIVQVLTKIIKTRHDKNKNMNKNMCSGHKKGISGADEVSIDVEYHPESRIHRREDSMDSVADTYEV